MAEVSLTYNALDDVTQIVDGVGTHSFTYDNLGKLLSLDGPFANDEQTFGYDSLQRLSSQSVQRGASGGVQSQSYAYDALGRLSTLTSNGTQGVGAFTYNYVGLTDMLSRLDLPNGTQTVQSYDALHRLTQVVNKKTGGADLNKFAYAYDNRDVRTAVEMKYGADPLRQVDYSYDAVDQLVGEAATGGVAGSNYSNAYSYDAMGNRLKRENTQGTTTALTRSGVNALNQLTSVSTSVDGGPLVTGGMSYDAAGNLTEMGTANGGRTLYVYDDADRLFRIEKRDAANVPLSKSEFIYDYASRKVVSQEFTYTAGAWVQGSEKRRVFDGMDVIQERDELNQVTAQLVRDGNIGGILSRSTSAGASFFSYDGSGNVTLLTDASGNEVGRYRYDAFGNTLEIAGTRAAENPYRFSTKELHGASGLYDFGFRFYSASMGRWINRDPLQEDGGLNLYAMVGNDPVNGVDEYGLQRTPYGTGHHIVPGSLWRAVGNTNTAVWNVFNADQNRLDHPLYRTHNRRRYGGIREGTYSRAVREKLMRYLSDNGIGPANGSLQQRLNSMTATQAQCFTDSIKRSSGGVIGKYNAAVKAEIKLAVFAHVRTQGAAKGWSRSKIMSTGSRILGRLSRAWSVWSLFDFMYIPSPNARLNRKTGKWEEPRGGYARLQPENNKSEGLKLKLARSSLDALTPLKPKAAVFTR